MTRISDMTPLTSLPATGAFVPVEKTGSTTNYRYDLSNLANLNGLFVNASSLVVPTDITIVSTTGYSALGIGGANYIYDATVGAAYVATHPRTSFISANSRGFRLLLEEIALSTWWGVSPSATDAENTAAYNAAIVELEATAINDGFGYNKGGLSLRTPAGLYLFNAELTGSHAAIEHCGDFTGGPGGGGTVFHWTNATCHGFNLKRDNAGKDSSVSTVRGIWLQGAYDYTTGTRGSYHAVNFNSIVNLIDVWASNWPGDAFHGFGNIATVPNTNVSNSFFCRIGAQFCDWTLTLQGGDANACDGINVSGLSNRFGTINDLSDDGNHWSGGQCEGSGNDPRYHVRSEKSGHIYAVAFDQEVWCSTNSPSGTTAHNTGWIYLYDGAASTTQPTWTTAQTWYFGAPICFNPNGGSNHSTGIGHYLEDFNPVVMGVRGKLIPAGFDGSIMRFITANGSPHGGVLLYGSDSGVNLVLNGGLEMPGSLLAYGDTTVIGPQTGTLDNTINLDTRNSSVALIARLNGTAFARILFSGGNGIFYDAQPSSGHVFGVGTYGATATIMTVLSGGINLATGKVLSVNGVTVLTAASVDVTTSVKLGGNTILTAVTLDVTTSLKISGTQVVGVRKTGWAVDTGTAKRTANATYSGTAEAIYTQATVQTLMDAVRDLSQTVKALKDDIHATAGHGLIGT